MENTTQFHRCSIRVKGFDYTQEGAYFVTLVTFHRECIFGKIVDGKMRLNENGQIVGHTCEWLTNHFDYIKLDPYIIMPNHLHGIIWIHEMSRGGSRPAPTGKTIIKPLGQIAGVLKTVSAKHINRLGNSTGISVWQRNYYEHIVRDPHELEQIYLYIRSNPENWKEDPE